MQIAGEEDLYSIMLHAPVGICILHAESMTIETANIHLLKLINKQAEDLAGKSYREIFTLAKPGDESALKIAVEGRQHQDDKGTMIQMLNEKKEIVPVTFVYKPVKNNKGEVTRIAIWILENTKQALDEELAAINEELAATNEEYAAANEELAAANEELATTNEELLKTQENLRRSEKLFRSIALNIPGSLILVVDRNHRYMAIEGDIMERMGYDRRDYEGKHPSEISPERYEASRHLYERVLSGEKFSIERKAETGEFYLIHFVPLKNDDNIVESGLIITLDITEIKQAEEKSAKLAAIVETSDDAIVSKTLGSVVTSWNAAAERMFGYTAEEMIGQTIYKIIPEDRQNEEPHILSRLNTGERVDHFETRRLTKDGRLLDVSLTISPIMDKQGKIIGLSKIARDITDKKQEEQRKNDFIGMVSHELKTPLTSLAAIIQVAQKKLAQSDDQFLSDAMEKANQQARRMATMINSFLNISRLEAGKLLIEKQPFDLGQLLQEILEETRLTVTSHIFSLKECSNLTVNADRDKIISVISNLISNAVKYSPKGRQIDISCKLNGNMVIVSVKDEGMGIKPEDLGYIFDRYYRVETNHTRHISGFGIGLYLSAEIIKRHGGEIWAESELDKGSTFYFSLPRAESPDNL
ncbi:PAS domain S-box protein [Mucilaginibacter sp. Mucisp84]|uniref:PAS domain-containing sensor histidine kinase n=1 Tax=Mucilaginibacter sp. Mucisp84 TaxID=3243058 RepID=UPI0039A480ED